MKIDFDVDIDLANREDLLRVIRVTPASIVNSEGQYTKHNTGVYFQKIPRFPLEGYSTIDHKQAAEDGWFKVDLLNNMVYKNVRDPAHLAQLVAQEPQWDLLAHEEIVRNLYHINQHYALVRQHQPTSIKQLAMVLALIRPAKRHLVGKSWDEIEADIWTKPTDDSYYFKKSHAHAFAMVIAVQLNLLCEQSISMGADQLDASPLDALFD